MRRDPAVWMSALIASAVLLLVMFQTMGALTVTGAFGRGAHGKAPVVAPAYQSLDRALAQLERGGTPAQVRDPFQFGAPPADDTPKAAPPPAPRPAPAPLPVLTAIVWDNDPRAVVRWLDRDWTVREGGLFDVFQVTSITREQVSLRRGDETMVLKRRNPGE